LRHGVEATADTRVLEAVRKHGRSGELVFVTERTEIQQDGAVRVQEDRDLVYRSGPPAGATTPRPAGTPSPNRAGTPIGTPVELRVDAVSLFRFSALTANSHRIHYDARYAVEVEGFPSLVVHGPLLALALAESCRSARSGGEVTRFDYRLVSPSFEGEPLVLTTTRDAAGSTHATLTGPDGAIRARAEAGHGRAEASRP
jgi:3-methylfumaryl-CoA hydratase